MVPRIFSGAGILSLLLATTANRQNYVRVQSGGQTYVVHTESMAVQKNLKPADPQAGKIKFPSWLVPYKDAVPKRANRALPLNGTSLGRRF